MKRVTLAVDESDSAQDIQYLLAAYYMWGTTL